MKRFFCRCGNEIFFDNTYCSVCLTALGFVPEQQRLLSLDKQNAYRTCEHRTDLGCNWLLPATDTGSQCLACRLTRTIPDIALDHNRQRWARLEATKRRAFYMLLRLRLPIADRVAADGSSSLLFDFLEDRRCNRNSPLDVVYTGHDAGIITINVAEADAGFRSETQLKMQESYRTLLGHFRHELGHYFWMRLAMDGRSRQEFRDLFGDERLDYQTALHDFYRDGVRSDWRQHFISAYASAHPLEDWAECWAHYLHIRDTLETACGYNLVDAQPAAGDFASWLGIWKQLSVMLNSLNRSMGIGDAYPFVLNPDVERKLEFVDSWVGRYCR